MEESVTPLRAWGQEDRDALRLAIAAKNESQRACADRLRKLGSSGANQSTVSKWVAGTIARPHLATVLAVRAYVREAFPAGMPEASLPPPADTTPNEAEDFEETVRGITNEPFLGPRQGDFVDAVTIRIREGPAFTEADERQLAEQRRILGLA